MAGFDDRASVEPQSARLDPVGWLLWPLHRLVWADPYRRARKLIAFGAVEAGGGRDLVRAAELTPDPLLRRQYLRHASDEARHAAMFHGRGQALSRSLNEGSGTSEFADWAAPGERGIDGLDLAQESDASLLAFLHLSESAAARDFARYARVLTDDATTSNLFRHILRDEDRHMRYTHEALARIAPGHSQGYLWRARLRRFWKAYLRLASALAGIIAGLILTLQYFLLLPPFAWLAKRAARRAPSGWILLQEGRNR